MNLSKFFIDRPIFAGVLSLLIFLAGLIARARAADLRIPRGRAAVGRGARQLPRRQPEGDRRDRGHAARGSDQRRRGHALHEQPGDHRRPDDADRHLQARHRPRQGAAAGAEPRLAGRAAPARGGAPPGHHHHQELARPDDGGAPAVAQRPLRHDLPAQLRGAQRQGPPGARPGRGRRAAVRLGRLLDARLARPAEGGAARPVGERRGRRDPRARTCRPRPAWSAPRRACTGIDMQLSINAQGRLQNEEEFGDIIVKTGADGAVTRLRDIARLELGAADYSLRSLLDNKDAVAVPIFAAPGSNAHRHLQRRARRRWPSCKKTMPEGVDYSIVYDPTQFVRASIESVVHTLLEAIALVVLVVILFLQTWRASIIPLLAVPVSVIGTFAVMQPVRLLDQRAEPVRAGAGDRHRGRRRDRGGGERRAQHRGGPDAARGHLPRDARGVRARSSRSRWCWSRCSCRWPSSAASPASSTSSSR